MVLCIEAEPTVLATRKLVLEAAGYRVLTAGYSGEGLEMFTAHPVRAVIMEQQGRGAEGPKLIASMKRLKPQVPIVMLSAQMFHEAGEGVDAVVTKGENPAILLEQLQALLQQNHRNARTADGGQ